MTTTLVAAVKVMVANGAKIVCYTAVPDVVWHCQSKVFSSTLRVFEVQGYDIILGMDWLEACGDMWISW
jgi:hypothetical protein